MRDVSMPLRVIRKNKNIFLNQKIHRTDPRSGGSFSGEGSLLHIFQSVFSDIA